jgi:hypothetical protein
VKRISTTCGWLLQSIARAAFFAGFIYTLWRAWRLGWGVLLARILQLKLIHTVLVVTALLLLGRILWRSYFNGYGYLVPWPLWLQSPLILAVLVAAALSIGIVSRMRSWPTAVFTLLTGLFLYAGGPHVVNEYVISQPIVTNSRRLADGSTEVTPSTDVALIRKRAEQISRSNPAVQFDVAANQLAINVWRIRPAFGVWTDRGRYTSGSPTADWYALRSERPTGRQTLTGPVVAAGGGIGWLAVPIPFLGLIGLIGLVLIMGRRGPAEFLAYSAICVLAIIATILPFVFGRTLEQIFEFSALGMMQSPLPAFEDLLTYYQLDWSWVSLVGGLVFSAGVPWLLAGLFLKPERGTLPPVDEQVAE